MSQPIIDLPDESRIPSSFEEGQLIDRLIDESLVTVCFQPIVDLRSRKAFAYEVLCRPQDGFFRTPIELVTAAARTKRMGLLGRHLRSLGSAQCPDLPIFLNIDPTEFDAPYLVRPDDPIFRHKRQVYLEITEAVPLRFFNQCHGVLAELRTKNLLLAIDDFGAGFSNLKYIAELEPEYVKLDRELVQGAARGNRKFELVKSISRLCHSMAAKVIAEGIETVEELAAMIAGGVDYGQGYLLALPNNPPPPVFWPAEMPLEDIVDFPDAETTDSAIGDNGNRQTQPRRHAEQNNAADLSHLEAALERVTAELTEANRDRFMLAERLKEMFLRVDDLQKELQHGPPHRREHA
ncbi:MAG: EAL domain-containing protein [Acidobacteriota bacterium]|nr:EAL domain-containing protein [Acidobacteriota bacterium]